MPVLAVEVAPRDQALDHHLLTLDEDHLMNTLRSNWKRLTFLRSACYRRKGGRNGTPCGKVLLQSEWQLVSHRAR